jgi:hypothetical protein
VLVKSTDLYNKRNQHSQKKSAREALPQKCCCEQDIKTMAEKTLKLHQEVDPIYFSPNFKPMVKLVEILSAEARRAKHTTEDDSDDDTLRTGVRVHALEGAVATLGDLGPAATVRDLRRAVARAVGVAAADQRLYASAAGRLELVKDDDATLLDAGVWLPDEPRGAVHLRSAAYERLQRQLATATGAVEQLLEQRYGPFHASVSSVRTTAAQYQTLRKLAADAKTSVDACGGPWRSTASRTARRRSPPARASSSTGRPRSRPRRRSGCWPN